MKRNTTYSLFSTLMALALVSSGFLFACKNTPQNLQNTEGGITAVKSRKAKGDVDFRIKIEKPESAEYNELYELVKKETVLEDFVRSMNNRIEFPGEVTIKIEECGEDNAFYNPADSTISICYEFIDHMMSIQDEKMPKSERLLYATAFTLLHEMGHAMVDRLDLPITGKEENAVDELAMVILMSDTTDLTYYAAIEGAMQFYYESLDENVKKYPFYDVHAPSIERYYDMLALIVGSDPEGHKDLVGEKKDQLHPDRAEHAEDDYHKKLDSWQRLLGDAWKE
jgi:Putative metallopeptidase